MTRLFVGGCICTSPFLFMDEESACGTMIVFAFFWFLLEVAEARDELVRRRW